MKHFKTKHETTNAFLPSVLKKCGEGVDGGEVLHAQFPPPLQTLQEHSANDVVWISPKFTVCGNIFEHPDYHNIQSYQRQSSVKNCKRAGSWKVM